MIGLDPIETRARAATPGPWIAQLYDGEDWEIQPVARGQDYGICSQPDAEFIAHAREDIPALVAEVERLRTKIDSLKTSYDHEVAARVLTELEIERLQIKLRESIVTGKDDVVVFIEFLDRRPFALVTADDNRYDVDYDSRDDSLQYHRDESLRYHRCSTGRCYPVCYLEHSDHEYWAAPGIVVTKNNGDPAPPENKIELPVFYRDSAYHQWPNMFER